MKLQGKVSIITGAASGIGRAAALKFAVEGARVVVCDLDSDQVEAVVAEIERADGQALGCPVDVTERAALAAMVETVRQRYGRIDTLVNNAGIVMDARLQKMSDEQFDRVVDVNLKGTFNCAQAVLETMIAQREGVIINTSSIAGVYGNFGQSNYAATKAGVIGLAKTWARELGRHNIRANAVCPGLVATAITKDMPERVIHAMEEKVPLQRLGRPEEIANVYAFLASDEASYLNGAVIEVSGGMTL